MNQNKAKTLALIAKQKNENHKKATLTGAILGLTGFHASHGPFIRGHEIAELKRKGLIA